jgi:hypothetical protein
MVPETAIQQLLSQNPATIGKMIMISAPAYQHSNGAMLFSCLLYRSMLMADRTTSSRLPLALNIYSKAPYFIVIHQQ